MRGYNLAAETQYQVGSNNVKGTLLLVDDDLNIVELITNVLEDLLTNYEYRLVSVSNGEEAWTILKKNSELYDVVLLDRKIPGMDGLTILQHMKSHSVLKTARVIIQTGLVATSDILDGMREGASHYLTKPYNNEILKTIVRTAIEERETYKKLLEQNGEDQHILSMLTSADFHIKTINEANELAGILARVSPNPEQAVIGFLELLINAIEHGNLGIGYKEKSKLVLEGEWEQVIQNRLLLDIHKNKTVHVKLIRSDKSLEVHIRDQGEGFDWRKYLDFDEKRMFDIHGRGIAMTNKIYFKNLEYRDCGNHVIVSFDNEN